MPLPAPRVYVRDAGLLHTLLSLDDARALAGHPKVGASFEGFALEQLLNALGGSRNAYFWRTHAGAELDLLLFRGGKRYGFEFKMADAPGTTRSMHAAFGDLGLERLWVVYPGDAAYRLSEKIAALPVREIPAFAARFPPAASL